MARRTSTQRVGKEQIKREVGYVYYLGADGYVWGEPTDPSGGGRPARVGTEKITRQDGYGYFLDMDGYVARAHTEEVSKEPVKLEPGYFYYLASDGYVWKRPTVFNPNLWPARVGTERITPQYGYVYLVDDSGLVVRAPTDTLDEAPTPGSRATHTVVIREIVKIPCPHCGSLYEVTLPKCPFCGAPPK
jgi:hypothetical protein